MQVSGEGVALDVNGGGWADVVALNFVAIADEDTEGRVGVVVRFRWLTSRACTKLCVLLPSTRITTGWFAIQPNMRRVSWAE